MLDLDHAGAAVKAQMASTLGGTVADLSFQLTDPSGWPDGSGGLFVAVINRLGSTPEKVLCSARTGATVTIWSDGMSTGRAFDGTTIAAHQITEYVEHVTSAYEADQLVAHVNADQNVHGVTGPLASGDDLDDAVADLAALTTVVAGKVAKSTLTGKGTIVTASAAATPAALTVGADDQVVAADSTAGGGLAYVTPFGKFLGRTTVSAAAGVGQSIDSLFLAKYDFITGRYRWATAASTANVKATLRVGGVPSGVHYFDSEGQADAAFFVIAKANVNEAVGEFTLVNVADAVATGFFGECVNAIKTLPVCTLLGGSHTEAVAYDGIHIDPSTSTLTGFIDWYGWSH